LLTHDLIGKSFGRLTVVEKTDKRYDRKVVWRCECSCGNKNFEVDTVRLNRGNTRSCGCLRVDSAGQYKKLNLTGRQFGRWLALEGDIKRKNKKRIFWRCVCDCGVERLVSTEDLMSGHSTSCGCSNGITRVRHGLSYHGLYCVWDGMRQRCCNPKCTAYLHYGGRGITVCAEWFNSFKTFYDWAVSNGYRKGLTIDRIDNNGNYEPVNCRWVTQKENNRNKRTNRNITIGGQTKTVVEWAELYGISYNVLRTRLRLGWYPFDAVTIKPGTIRNYEHKIIYE